MQKILEKFALQKKSDVEFLKDIQIFYKRLDNYNHCGNSLAENFLDIEKIQDIVSNKLQSGKATGIDGISAEHLKYSHPLLI